MRRAGLVNPRTPPRYQSPQIWPPTKVASCRGWFDMLEIGSFGIVDGTVSSITNKVSGTAMATAATALPLFEPAGINGRPSMLGDGARGIMGTDATVLTAFSGTDLPFTVCYVAQIFGAAGAWTVASAAKAAANSTGSYSFNYLNTGPGKYSFNKRDDANASITPTFSFDVTPTPEVIVWRCSGVAMSVRVNGKQAETIGVDNGATTPDRIGMFVRPDLAPDGFLVGRLGCWLVFAEHLNEYETIGTENALMSRWGIKP